MKKEHLIKCFALAEEYGFDYVAVKIQMKGFELPEIIINPRENFNEKLNYYVNNYDADLTLKSYSGIKIVDATYGRIEDIVNFMK